MSAPLISFADKATGDQLSAANVNELKTAHNTTAGLVDANTAGLAGKAPTSHTHTASQVTDFSTASQALIDAAMAPVLAIIGSAGGDADSVVNTVREVLTVFATYPEGVDLLTALAGKVATADVVNVLTQTAAGKVLDARQGKALKDLIDALQASVTNNTTALATKADKLPTGQPLVMLRSALTSYSQPEVGKVTLAISRTGDVSIYQSSGLWGNTATGVAAYTYDPGTGLTRYKSTASFSSLVVGTANRDLTQAAWTATSGTAAKDQIGIDGTANAASSFTATAANATILHAITVASAKRTSSAFVKRITGGGRVLMTRNGGTTWKDITSQLSTDEYTRVSIISTLANPSVGFKLETSGDAIAVDAVNDTNSAFLLDPFVVTSASQGNSTLTLSAMSPTFVAGRRYEVKVQALITGTLPAVKVSDSAGQNYVNAQMGAVNQWSLAMYSGNAQQYSATGPSGTLALIAPRTYQSWVGKEVTLRLEFGLGKVRLSFDGITDIFQDTGGKLDPVGLDRLILSGNAHFSLLEIKELRQKNFVLFGDSQTAASEYVNQFTSKLDQTVTNVRTRGIAGNTIADLQARYATDITPIYHARAASNELYLRIGTNSLAANMSAATALTDLTTLISNIRSAQAGWRITVLTMLNRTAGLTNGATISSVETQRLLFNAGLSGVGGDRVLNLDVVTEMLDSTNTAYYLDGIHETGWGYQLLWDQVLQPAALS